MKNKKLENVLNAFAISFTNIIIGISLKTIISSSADFLNIMLLISSIIGFISSSWWRVYYLEEKSNRR